MASDAGNAGGLVAARRPAAALHPLQIPLVLSRVHWLRPELVAEVTYLTWTADNLLRQVVYEGLREDGSDREAPSLVGLRDRALIGVMVYSFARISAVVGMEVEDYFANG